MPHVEHRRSVARPASVERRSTPLSFESGDKVYTIDRDPRRVRVDLFDSWDREQDAFEDSTALAFASGPMYERHLSDAGEEFTVPLGDLKLGSRIARGLNRSAARQRAFIAIDRKGTLVSSYGKLTPEGAALVSTPSRRSYSLYNNGLEEPPDAIAAPTA